MQEISCWHDCTNRSFLRSWGGFPRIPARPDDTSVGEMPAAQAMALSHIKQPWHTHGGRFCLFAACTLAAGWCICRFSLEGIPLPRVEVTHRLAGEAFRFLALGPGRR